VVAYETSGNTNNPRGREAEKSVYNTAVASCVAQVRYIYL